MATIDDLSAQQFYHGTKIDLKPGDLIEPGYNFHATGNLTRLDWGIIYEEQHHMV